MATCSLRSGDRAALPPRLLGTSVMGRGAGLWDVGSQGCYLPADALKALSGSQFPSVLTRRRPEEIRMRFLLIVYLFLTPTGDPHPVTIPQSTAASCETAAQKIRADLQPQVPTATTLAARVATGSAY